LVFNEPTEKVGTTAGELLGGIRGPEFRSAAVVARFSPRGYLASEAVTTFSVRKFFEKSPLLRKTGWNHAHETREFSVPHFPPPCAASFGVKIQVTVTQMGWKYIAEIQAKHRSGADLPIFLQPNSTRLTLSHAYNLRIPEQMKSVGLIGAWAVIVHG
jgi:hypothetical protein